MRGCEFFWLVVVLLIQPISAHALSLGPIQLHSGLNEPLNAAIPLKGIQADQFDSLRVLLASKEHFAKAGLDRPYLLQQLRFSTESPSKTEHQIRITTDKTLREPTLNFLLEVISGNKRLIREYILLLNPPEHQAAAALATPPLLAKANTASRPPPASEAHTYGPVKYSDTLSEVAIRVRPAPHLNIYQIMVALLRTNPHAFVHGNINNLRKGVVLKIPGIDAIGKISKRQARRSVMDHASKIELASAPKARNESQEQPNHIPPTQQVAVEIPTTTFERNNIPPTQQVAAEIPTTTFERNNILQLEELLRQQAVSPMTQQPATSVQQPPASLTETESKLKHLLADYSELEVILRKYEQTIRLLETGSSEKNSTIDSLVTTAEQLRKNIATRMHEVAQLQAIIKGNGITRQTKPTVQLTLTTQDEIAREKPLLLWLILSLVVISGLVMWLLRRRERSKSQPSNNFRHLREKEESKTAKPEQATPTAKSPPTFTAAKPVIAEKSTAPHARQLAVEPPPHKPPQQSNIPESPKDIKLIYKELDIYLAYRHFSKAEQLLNTTLRTHPDNMLLKVKRLDVYAFRNKKDHFFHYLSTLESELDERAPEHWKHVLELVRRFVPDHALIAEKAMIIDEIDLTKSTILN